MHLSLASLQMYFSPPSLTVASEMHQNCSQADSPLQTTGNHQMFWCSLRHLVWQERTHWVLSIIQHTAVHVSGYPEAAPRQSVITLTLDAVVTEEVKENEALCYG